MSEVEYLGMSPRDWNRKCGGTILINPNYNGFFQFESVSESPEEEEDGREEGEEVLISVPSPHADMWEHRRVGYDVLNQSSISFPLTGYVNYKGYAYHLGRQANKQWHVGYNNRVISYEDPFADERAEKGMMGLLRSAPSLPSFIHAVLNRKWYTYQEALLKVKYSTQSLSCAFHRYLMISRSLHFDKVVLMYKNRHIGFVGDDDRPIIFPPAEYVARIMPVIPVIKEDYADVSIRNKWD